ncbi:uncharacterized protein N7473_004417 [Penicillium subrubescens]|uniref:uncharacterized protein n=1 Tax=Penicillium subrubescens TaxID=1316194 RepID=UPI00254594F1|nr:uncharacterized protein N7473_004417 [Penicillium subrubescens]KAJ5900347.1 hypothetical protein N7473_004417 [Penicillium subrubescens]
MGCFSNDSVQAEAYRQVNDSSDNAELSVELLGAAASYQAMKEYEDHVARNGKPDSYPEAKSLAAAFVASSLQRLIEIKDLDCFDAKKAQGEAENHVEGFIAEDYF